MCTVCIIVETTLKMRRELYIHHNGMIGRWKNIKKLNILLFFRVVSGMGKLAEDIYRNIHRQVTIIANKYM